MLELLCYDFHKIQVLFFFFSTNPTYKHFRESFNFFPAIVEEMIKLKYHIFNVCSFEFFTI